MGKTHFCAVNANGRFSGKWSKRKVCAHPSAFHGALLRWPISIVLLLFLEQRQFFWIHYLCCCSHHWCVLLSQIHSLSRLFSSSSESYSKNRDCFADGRKEKVFSKCIVLFFFSPLKLVASCSAWLIAVHPATSLNAAQKHPTDPVVLFLSSEFPLSEIDAQVSELLTKTWAPRTHRNPC